MIDNIFKKMLEEYKKVVQIPFEEYKEQTKKDKKEVFQFMVHKMANDDIKLFESLEKSNEYIEMIEEEIERQKEIIRQLDIKNLELTTIIKEVREYIDGNLENTSQTLRFDENKSYNTALLELKEILDKENNNDSD